jgi:hypothetical protein
MAAYTTPCCYCLCAGTASTFYENMVIHNCALFGYNKRDKTTHGTCSKTLKYCMYCMEVKAIPLLATKALKETEQMYPCWTSALDVSGWSAPRPGRYTPDRQKLYRSIEGGGLGTVCVVSKNFSFTVVRSTDRPACGRSLYRLIYTGRIIHSTLGKINTGVPPYPRVILSKTHRGYVKPRIIPNAIYNVIFV